MQLPKKLVAARKHSLMVGIVPTGLRGHRRRESTAQGRGASRQSQVQGNSCASRYTVAKPPKASLHAVHGECTYEEGNQRTTERDNEQYSSHLQPNSVE